MTRGTFPIMCITVGLLGLSGCNPSDVSDQALASNLTPELSTVGSTPSDVYWNDHIIYDLQGRELGDDWQSFWLMKSPSKLSPYPIMDLSQPQ